MDFTKKKEKVLRRKTKKRGGAASASVKETVQRILTIPADRRNEFMYTDPTTYVKTPLNQLIMNTRKYHQTVLFKSLVQGTTRLLRNGQVYNLKPVVDNVDESFTIELDTNLLPSPYIKKKDIHELPDKRFIALRTFVPIYDFFKILDTGGKTTLNRVGNFLSNSLSKVGKDVMDATGEMQQMFKGNTESSYDTSSLQKYVLNMDPKEGVKTPEEKRKADIVTKFAEKQMDMGYEVEIPFYQVVMDWDYLVGLHLAVESVAEQFGMPSESRMANYENKVSLSSTLQAVLIYPNLQPANQQQRDEFHKNVVAHIGNQIVQQEKLRQKSVDGFLPDIVVTSSSNLLPSFVFRRYLKQQVLPPLEKQSEEHTISDRVHMFV